MIECLPVSTMISNASTLFYIATRQARVPSGLSIEDNEEDLVA